MRRLNFYLGLFCITAATLMLQLTQTRILSVVAWYHLAFLVIGTAMLGLTAGAVRVYQGGAYFSEKTLSHDLAQYSAGFALVTALALGLQMTLTPLAQPGLVTIIIWSELIFCLALPFYFSGIAVSLALTRSPFPFGRVYGVDMAGAALGCLGVLVLLDLSDGPSAVLWTSALAALGAVFFAHSGVGAKRDDVPGYARILQRPTLLCLLLVAAAFLNSADSQRLGLRPIFAKDRIELITKPWFEQWNSFSRVVAEQPFAGPPHLWGPSPRYREDDWRIEQSEMRIDGDAATVAYGIAGDVEQAQFLKYDVTNLAYYLPGRRSAAIIGVGGGRDLLSARVFGVAEITGVEINPIFIELIEEHPEISGFVGLTQLEGLSLVVDEARSWFARSGEAYDVVQMSLIDTWAATGAGAFTLSENGLYTLEAWQILLRRLTPRGVFTVSRWYATQNLAETGRMVSLAVAALMEEGAANPRDHIVLATSGHIATLLVSRSGFTADELAALNAVAAELEFRILIEPNHDPKSQVLRRIVEAGDREELYRYTSNLDLDLTPPTDDRPFFFNQLPLYDAAKVVSFALLGQATAIGTGTGNLLATINLVKLFAISLFVVLAIIVIPLRSALRDVGPRLAGGGTLYFMLIGLGFMLVEISLLQRFSVFLGHPIYSLSIVLFSLILATGLGSVLSDYLILDRPRLFLAWALATSAYLLSLTVWMPPLLLLLDSSGLIVRALAAVLVILPAGLLMGFAFPTGMRLISAVDRTPTPWFWGINGACGVLASAMAVASSIAYGIGTTLTIGALCYLLLIPAGLIIGFRRGAASEGRHTTRTLDPPPFDPPAADPQASVASR